MEQAYARKSKRYQLSEAQDITLHSNLIRKIEAFTQGKLFVLEDNSTKIKLYSGNLDTIGSLIPPKKSKFEQKGVIIDFDYSE